MSTRPNVLAIIFDDTGFGHLGCFGGPVPTPNLDQLAAGGLRYNRFHVTAMCSPTRAAFLTGQNHHAVGFGFLADIPLELPGYRAKIPQTAVTMAEVLKDEGYATWAVGKWHLTPRFERSPAGPFDTWPLGKGFEKYYGFLQGDTNQYAPNLIRDNSPVEPPQTPAEGYHLSEDLARETERLLVDLEHHAPGKPFFCYLALGAMHAPHHVDESWVAPFRGKFDQGWDVVREQTFARQLELGIVPPGTTLTERPPWVRAWSDLSEAEQRAYARQQEVFAGFLAHTDHQVGKILDVLRRQGKLDSTLTMVFSDNGASAEGGVNGSQNEHRFTSGIDESFDDMASALDSWGDESTYPHYSWGWAWAGNTPFRLWKRYTWLGGTRTPLIVHWPDGTDHVGQVRSQFVHAIDLFPTVLDALHLDAPTTYRGTALREMDGASIATSFTDRGAPSARETQYFELLGSRSMIVGKYKATTDHVSSGVGDEERLMTGSRDFAMDHWALFDLERDFSESTDVAASHREVVDSLEQRWQQIAEANHVVPMADSIMARTSEMIWSPYPPPSPLRLGQGGGPVSDEALPLLAFGFEIEATVTVPTEASGVIYAIGDWNGGMSLHLEGGVATFTYARASLPFSVQADEPLDAGIHHLVVRYLPSTSPATFSLAIDGVITSATEVHGALPFVFQHGGAALRLGFDNGLPVTASYQPPAHFEGVVESVTIVADPHTDGDLRAVIETALHAD